MGVVFERLPQRQRRVANTQGRLRGWGLAAMHGFPFNHPKRNDMLEQECHVGVGAPSQPWVSSLGWDSSRGWTGICMG